MNKIFVFSNVVDGKDGPCYAMAEDGTILGSHHCSHENYAKGDLGVLPESRPDRHITYKEHYPDGYEMEFVESSKIDNHTGLQSAFELNSKLDEDKKSKGSHTSIEITVAEE